MTRTAHDSILLNTFRGIPSERPPFWFMRQAGRVLPSYLELKKRYSFWEMMQDPQLAAKVTLLPVHDLQVDAAILFSDILVVPYAMGMGLDFTDQGPVFHTPLAQEPDPLKALNPDPSRLEYIYNAIDLIIDTKPEHIPLIGFCGAPLTVLCYMLQGTSRRADFSDALHFIHQNRKTTNAIVDRIAELSIEYARQQVHHGVEVFQLFETHGGIIPYDMYQEIFLPAVRKIAGELKALNTPFIFFPKGIGTGISTITPDHCDYLGIDWQTPLPLARKMVHPSIGLQGNINPRLLYTDRDIITAELEKLIPFGKENRNWIINLGHGFMPDTPYQSAKLLSEWIRNADWRRNGQKIEH